MHVTITGAGGFIGKNLLLGLSPDHHLIAIDRGGELPGFVEDHSLAEVEIECIDLTDQAALSALAEKRDGQIEAVIYLAGNGDPAYSVSHPDVDLTDTVLGLVHFLQHFTVGRFIYFSSGAVYDGLSGAISPSSRLDPRLPYAIGKLACEQYIKFFQKTGRIDQYVILRFFGAYGPYEPPRKIYTRLVKRFALERKPSFTIRGDGQNLIDAMFVEDTVRGVSAVLKSDAGNRVVDFCLGEPLTIKQLVEAAARIFEIEAVIETAGRVPEYIDFRPSSREMEELFGFTPKIPLSEGLPILASHLADTPGKM